MKQQPSAKPTTSGNLFDWRRIAWHRARIEAAARAIATKGNRRPDLMWRILDTCR